MLDVLERLTHVRADRTELTDIVEQMMTEVAAIANAAMPKSLEDLGYIG